MKRWHGLIIGLVAAWLLSVASAPAQFPPLGKGDDPQPRLEIPPSAEKEPLVPGLDPALRPLVGAGFVPEPHVAAPPLLPFPGPVVPYVPPTNVSFLDYAPPLNMVRFRFEAGDHIYRPTRAEAYLRNGGPKTAGLPLNEQRLDYQDFLLYGECVVIQDYLSGFAEVPYRFINPDFNANHNGFGDIRLGAKLAWIQLPLFSATIQFAARTPTGNESDGLGTSVLRLEPSILANSHLTDNIVLEGQIEYSNAVGGTFLAGDWIRMGSGISYNQPLSNDWWIAPVFENQLWTILSGREVIAFNKTNRTIGTGRNARTVRLVDVADSSGEGIWNSYLGVRAGLGGRFDCYAGYGRSLTGDAWYKNIWRVEFRWLY